MIYLSTQEQIWVPVLKCTMMKQGICLKKQLIRTVNNSMKMNLSDFAKVCLVKWKEKSLKENSAWHL